jgi:hypothetical protein
MLNSLTRWTVAFLAAGAATVLSGGALAAESAAASSAGSSSSVAIQKDDTSVLVACSGRTLMDYCLVANPAKPYVRRLYTPGGVNVLRDQVIDHKHHHGLMYAIGADGVNFWEETPGCGSEVPHKTCRVSTSTANGPARASLGQDLDWVGPKSPAPILLERRTIVVGPSKDGSATLLTWRSTFSAPPGRQSVKLGGSHYYGLGMRFPISMDKGGHFLYSADKKKAVPIHGDEQVMPASWSAYTASAEGKPVTVALFESPADARFPSPIFTMQTPFAYQSATLNLWKEPLLVQQGQPLDLRYGVALWDGQVEPAVVEAMYQQWLAEVKDER